MRIIIFGGGQTGTMVASILQEYNSNIIGFIDDAEDVKMNNIKRLGNRSWLLENPKAFDVVCIGTGTIRSRKLIATWLIEQNIKTVNAIHKSAVISKDVSLGDNLIIGANTTLYINPSIGNGCFIGPGVTVSHDTKIGDYCLLSVGSIIGARCDIYNEVLVGSGAVLMPPAFDVNARLQVGPGSIIGVGSTVIRDVPANDTVVGCPAKSIRKED